MVDIPEQQNIVETSSNQDSFLGDLQRNLKTGIKKGYEEQRTEDKPVPLPSPKYGPVLSTDELFEKYARDFEKQYQGDSVVGEIGQFLGQQGAYLEDYSRGVVAGAKDVSYLAMQLPQFLMKYGVGGFEQNLVHFPAYQLGLSERQYIPYDELYVANTPLKQVADDAAELQKNIDKDIAPSNPSYAYSFTKWLTSFSLTFPVAGGFTGPVSRASMKTINNNYSIGRNIATDAFDLHNSKILQSAAAPKMAAYADRVLKPIQKRLDAATANKDWVRANKFRKDKIRAEEKILKDALKKLKPGEYVLGYKKKIGEDGKIIYVPAKQSRAQLSSEELIRTTKTKELMTSLATTQAAALTALVEHNYRDTPLENLKHMAGLAGFFLTPPVITKLLSATGDMITPSLQNYVGLNLTEPFGGPLRMLPFGKNLVESDMYKLLLSHVPANNTVLPGGRLNLSGLIYAISRMGKTQDQLLENPTFMKRMYAMTQGVPFYKALYTDDAKKIAGFDSTALDMLITFDKNHLKTLDVVGKMLARELSPETKEGLKAYSEYVRHMAAQLDAIGPVGEDLTKQFINLQELMLQGMYYTGAHKSFQMLSRDPANRNFLFGGADKTKGKGQVLYEKIAINIPWGKGAATSRVNAAFRSIDAQRQMNVLDIEKTIKELLDKTDDPRVGQILGDVIDAAKTFVKTQSEDIASSQAYWTRLAETKNKLVNSELAVKLDDAIFDGFGLTKGDVPMITTSAGPNGTSVWTADNYGTLTGDLLSRLYDKASKTADESFEKLRTEDYDKAVSAYPFLRIIDDLSEDAQDFSNIIPILKNKQNQILYPTGAVGTDSFDIVRYNLRLRGLQEETTDKLLSIALNLRGRSLNPETGLFGRTEIGLISRNFEDAAGNVKTLQVEETDNVFDIERTFENKAIIEQNALKSGLSTKQYLTEILARLRTTNPVLNKQLNHTIPSLISVRELHSYRKGMSKYAWNKKNQEVGVMASDYTERVDLIFDNFDITSVKEANNVYTNFRKIWHEAHKNKPLFIQAVNPQFIDINVGPATLLHKMFLSDNIPEIKKLFENMAPKGSKIELGNNTTVNARDYLQDLIGKGLGIYLLDNGYMFHGLTRRQSSNRLSALEKAGLISKEHADAARTVTNAGYDEAGVSITEEASKIMATVNNRIDRLSDNAKDALNISVSKRVAQKGQEDGVKGVYEYIVGPESRGLFPSAPVIKDVSLEQRDRAAKLQAQLEPAAQANTTTTVEELQRSFNPVAPVGKWDRPITSTDEIINTRFETAVREIYGIDMNQLIRLTEPETFTKLVEKYGKNSSTIKAIEKQQIQIKNFRDSLIYEAMKRSKRISNRRRSEVGLTGEPAKPRENGDEIVRDEGFFGLDAELDIQLFSNHLVDLQPILNRTQKAVGDQTFNSRLGSLYDLLVGVQGKGAPLTELLTEVPANLTYASALSRLYAGFRGVVSWRYLVSEQLVREHQRSKAKLIHAVLTDPNYTNSLIRIMKQEALPASESSTFIKRTAQIMGPRFAVWDSDKNAINYKPTNENIIEQLGRYFLQFTQGQLTDEYSPIPSRVPQQFDLMNVTSPNQSINQPRYNLMEVAE